MSYTFSTLSPADFEDLVRDLIGLELGVRFETFCAGPDGGIDGRHAPSRGSKPVVLQAKHYEGSTFPQLLSAMKRERAAIGKANSLPLYSHDLTKADAWQQEDAIRSDRHLRCKRR